MKILKAVGNFIVKYDNLILLAIYLGVFLASAWQFSQNQSLANAAGMICWLLIMQFQVVYILLVMVRENQTSILRDLAKLRHPSYSVYATKFPHAEMVDGVIISKMAS